MYWSQPLIECHWPRCQDPFPDLLGDQHLLCYDSEFDFRTLTTHQTLSDLCDWANSWLARGIDAFVDDERNHYDIANLVKLNMWAADIRAQGIVKPWLILDWGNGTLEAGTGDSRLRLLEIMPEITSVPAFVSTHVNRASLYTGLEQVTTLDRFAKLCGAGAKQQFLFRPTDAAAPFGIYWYEYDSEKTRAVTPDQTWCVKIFEKFYQVMRPHVTPAWFLTPIDWQQFDKKS